jgi:predicted GIY-YIG superfamily endonuclease
MKAKSILVYLPNGDANKFSKAHVTNDVIDVIFLNKSEIDNQRKELEKIGCYLLIGKDNAGRNAAYIGKAENIFKRLNDHRKDSNKDFWESVYAITNTRNDFDNAYISYLEQLMIKSATEAQKFDLKNSNNGNKTNIPENKIEECKQFFDTANILLKTLGLSIFVPEISKTELKQELKYYFKSNKDLWNAVGVYHNDKFIVLKDSKTRKEQISQKSESNELKFIKKLLADGYLVENSNNYIFIKDFSFNSPSMAADVVSLTSRNGWLVWKTENGVTLDEKERKNKTK